MLYDILFAVIFMTVFLFCAFLAIAIQTAYDLGGDFEIEEFHGRRKGLLERILDGWEKF